MSYSVFATDYDGTLAHRGTVPGRTIDTLSELKANGWVTVLVTGRIEADLETVFHRLDLFTWIVAENGAVLFHPASGERRLLAEPPPDSFVVALRDQDVTPLEMGHVIVATREPHDSSVLDVVREQGLELQVIFNKGAVMILPAGVSKGTGLAAALRELHADPAQVVAVGDAENDHSLLDGAGLAVAVGNAIPALKARADIVVEARASSGVNQLMRMLIRNELRQDWLEWPGGMPAGTER